MWILIQGFIWTVLFEGTVTGHVYLNMLRTFILPAIHQLYGNEPFYFQQDGAPPHHHPDVRSYFDETLPGQWIRRRGSVEYPPFSRHLSPRILLVSSLKDVACHRKRPTLRCYGKKLKSSVSLSQWTRWPRLLVH
jgi:hypothetical protein